MAMGRLLCGAAAVALLAPAALTAQTANPRDQAPASGPVGASTGGQTVAVPPTGATQPAQSEGLEDIIVTASKVTSNVQKVPVAITTLSGEELLRTGVTDATQLNKLVPGVRVEQAGGGNVSFFIRGIGSTVLNAFGDPANAFSVDGVYFSRPSGPNATLFDVARVEVVKGPQGTLYGRNATGGAFNVVTNRPTFVRGMDVSVEAGNYQAIRASAALNLPISDTLALRIAGQTTYRNGYFSDGYDDDDVKAGRVSLLFKPDARLSVFLSGDYAHTGGMGAGTVPIGGDGTLATRYVVPGDARVGPSDPRIRAYASAAALTNSPGILVNTPFATICLGARLPTGGAIPLCSYPLGIPGTRSDGFVDNQNYGGNLTVDYDLGFASVTATGGYRGTETNGRYYIGPSAQAQQTKVDQYSGELRLASDDRGQPLKWIVGAFYLKETQNFNGQFESDNLAIPNPAATPGSPLPATTCLPPAPGPALPPALCATAVTVIQNGFSLALPHVEDETYAFFGQATYSLADWFRVTGGVRYTHETKDSTNGVSRQFYTRPAGVTTQYPSAGGVRFNDTSYRAGIELDVAPRSMLYAQFSTAYHAGGINLGVAAGPVPYLYAPEKVHSYTVGAKNRFFDNTLQLNVEGFWLDYDNLQVNSLGRINDGSVPCSTLNIVAACPLALRTDNAGKARFKGVEADVQWQPWRGGSIFANILYNDSRYRQFAIPDVTGALVSYAGERVGAVSPLTISGGISQSIPLGNGGALIPEARTQYKGDTYMYYVHAAGNFQKAYTRTDLSLTYQAPQRRFSVTGYVRNVENHDTLLQGFTRNAETGVPWNYLNPPRTYGVILGAHF